jgi:uncharacterized protein (TIGR03118 family)
MPTPNPPPAVVCGAPTGLVSNPVQLTNPPGFEISGFTSTGATTMAPAHFLFATEDGTIVGWAPTVNPFGFNTAKAGTYLIIAKDNSSNPTVSSGAVYKGLAVATDTGGTTRLYVTNFRAGTVEMYDTTFTRVISPGAFTDPDLPSGYAPFNIVHVAGKLFVTFAVQDAAKHDDVAGMGHGIVDTFDLSGHLLQRFAQFGQLNSPWGVALAPARFGQFADFLLIGNFGNGQINGFNPGSGQFLANMRDPNGQMLAIDGLWSLLFGNGGNGGDPNTLYFTAGPNGETDGLFGALTPSCAGVAILFCR